MLGLLGAFLVYVVGMVAVIVAIRWAFIILALGLHIAIEFICEMVLWVLGALVRGGVGGVVWLGREGDRWIEWSARQCGKGLYLGALFLFCLAYEKLRGPQKEAPEEDFGAGDQNAPQEDHEQPLPPDEYVKAVAFFNLPNNFTQTDLDRVYKTAIKKAHPDAGGSVEKAQAINAARDEIARHKGWK